MATRQSIIRQRYIREFMQYGYLMCGLCKLAIGVPDDITVDHIVPKAKGGTTRVDNLQPAHRRCNELKKDDEHVGEFKPWELEKLENS